MDFKIEYFNVFELKGANLLAEKIRAITVASLSIAKEEKILYCRRKVLLWGI